MRHAEFFKIKRGIRSIFTVAAIVVYLLIALDVVQDARAAVSSTSNFKRSDGTGALTTFTFTFRVLENSDLQVYLVTAAHVATRQTEGVDYDLTLNSGGLGGTVEFDTAPALTEDVIMVNVPALTQPATFSPGGPFSEADLETALDRAVLNDTAQQEELARAVKLTLEDPLNTTDYGGLFIAAESSRAGKILKWNDDGDGIEAGTLDATLSDIADDAAAIDASAAAAASSASGAATSASAAAVSAAAALASETAAGVSEDAAAASASSVIAAWKGPWITSTAYVVGDRVSNGGSSYIAILAHTAGASTEPGVGGGWTAAWNLLAAKGAAGAGTGDLLAANNLSDLVSAATARTNLALVVGTNVQAYDAELAALAGLTSAADKGIQWTGSGTAATYDLTTAGKALLDDANAAAQRATLGLGTAATGTTGTSAGNVVVLNGSAQLPAVDGSLLTGITASGITCTAATATTSGTAVNYTSIPSGTKRITVNFVGVSLSGSDALLVQIGDSGGLEASGYTANSHNFVTNYSYSTGYGFSLHNGGFVMSGSAVFTLVDSTTRTWVTSSVMDNHNGYFSNQSGYKALTAELDRLTILPEGANTFDAGMVNICYE